MTDERFNQLINGPLPHFWNTFSAWLREVKIFGETKMTDERFNELINGPLLHPVVTFVITRLTLALRAVVEECGPAGDAALERHCAARAEQDEERVRDEMNRGRRLAGET